MTKQSVHTDKKGIRRRGIDASCDSGAATAARPGRFSTSAPGSLTNAAASPVCAGARTTASESSTAPSSTIPPPFDVFFEVPRLAIPRDAPDSRGRAGGDGADARVCDHLLPLHKVSCTRVLHVWSHAIIRARSTRTPDEQHELRSRTRAFGTCGASELARAGPSDVPVRVQHATRSSARLTEVS